MSNDTGTNLDTNVAIPAQSSGTQGNYKSVDYLKVGKRLDTDGQVLINSCAEIRPFNEATGKLRMVNWNSTLANSYTNEELPLSGTLANTFVTATTTLVTNQLFQGVLICNPGAAATLTLPNGSAITGTPPLDGASPYGFTAVPSNTSSVAPVTGCGWLGRYFNLKIGDSFRLLVKNINGTNAVTFAAGSAGTKLAHAFVVPVNSEATLTFIYEGIVSNVETWIVL